MREADFDAILAAITFQDVLRAIADLEDGAIPHVFQETRYLDVEQTAPFFPRLVEIASKQFCVQQVIAFAARPHRPEAKPMGPKCFSGRRGAKAAKKLQSLGFKMSDELQDLAWQLHIAAMEAGKLRVVRRLITQAWNATVDFYGHPDEDEAHPYAFVAAIISKFASFWDEADRMQRESDQQSLASVGTTFHGYRLVKSLEGGGMSEAYMAENTETGQKVFVKRVRVTSRTDKAALEREMSIYAKLACLRLDHFADIVERISDNEFVALVTEFAAGGDLQQYVEEYKAGRGLEPADARNIARSIAAALQELHRNQIVHRDLKPRNVFNFSGNWKVGDFGIAKDLERIHTERTFRPCGTLGYKAPEQSEGAPALPSADIYPFGKIIAFLLTGQTDVDMVPYPKWRDLAQRCICVKQQDRPTVEDVIRTLAGIPAI
jgi:hypothetical protein